MRFRPVFQQVFPKRVRQGARLGIRLRIRLGLLLALLPGVQAVAASPHGSFLPLTLDEALQRAAAEKRPVFIHVYADWSLPCQHMMRTTFAESRVIELLAERTVPIRIDGEAEPDLLKRYELDRYPTLLLLRPDASEQDRWQSYLPGPVLIDELTAALAGQDAIARALALLERTGRNEPMAHERLAEALFRQRRYAEALKEYLWCFDIGLERSIVYASARRQPLMLDLAALAARHPPTRAELARRREALAVRIIEEDDPNVTRNLAYLNRALGDDDASFRLYEQLPAGRRARRILFDHVFDELVARGRFDEILATSEPLESFVQEVRYARGPGGVPCCSAHARGPGARTYVIDRGVKLVEVLASVGREADAQVLIREVEKFDDTPGTRTALAEALQRGLYPVTTRPQAP